MRKRGSVSSNDSVTSGHLICLLPSCNAHILFIRVASDALMVYPCTQTQKEPGKG